MAGVASYETQKAITLKKNGTSRPKPLGVKLTSFLTEAKNARNWCARRAS